MTRPLSDHFNGKTFYGPRHENRTWADVLRWRRTSKPAPWPARVDLPAQPPPPAVRGTEWVATWINHATFLVQTAQGNFLTDPVYAERCGPFGALGPRRVHAPGLAFEALPRIDYVLLSHDHYDHCDLATLRRLAALHRPRAITPLANGPLLRRAGFKASEIVELDWWQSTTPAAGIEVTPTPARHWSNRLSGQRNSRLWSGFFVRQGGRAWWFAGDSGYDPELFKSIGERLGSPALAMIPIGAYEPRWFMAAQHCDPAEAVQIHRDVGAGTSLAMHWGTFQLTDEPREAPVEALAEARKAAGVSPDDFRALIPGESYVV